MPTFTYNSKTGSITSVICGQTVTVTLESEGVSIAVEGYGTKDMRNAPVVFMDLLNEDPEVLIWSDIERAEPDPPVLLEGALEFKRRPSIFRKKKETT